MSVAILSMEAVGLSFGNKRVLENLTFSVRRGEVFGFLGPSGSGKTTTIKLLTRQLSRDSGRISLLGRPIERATEADYERVGILSDTSALYDRMSIADNVGLYAQLRGVGRRRVPALLQRLGLADDAKTPIKHCSKGMRQRAALAAALVHEPELLFLDEPTSGLDPAARAEVHKLLAGLRARGATVFLTTHDMAEAETVCDRVAILADGAIAACDDPDELKLRYARNRITVRARTRGALELSKDAADVAKLSELACAGELLAVHSDEPNLEEVFLELTGREF